MRSPPPPSALLLLLRPRASQARVRAGLLLAGRLLAGLLLLAGLVLPGGVLVAGCAAPRAHGPGDVTASARGGPAAASKGEEEREGGADGAVSAGGEALLAAHGGRERLAALPGVHFRLRLTEPATGAVTQSEQWLDFRGGRLLQHDTGPTGGRRLMSDGRTGWVQDARGTRALTPAQALAVWRGLALNFLYLLPRAEVEPLAAGTGGPARYRVRGPGAALAPFTVEVDAHGRIATLLYADGLTGTESDYRDVQGVPWPFRFEVREGAAVRLTGEFLSFTLAPDLARVPFEAPRAEAPPAG